MYHEDGGIEALAMGSESSNRATWRRTFARASGDRLFGENRALGRAQAAVANDTRRIIAEKKLARIFSFPLFLLWQRNESPLGPQRHRIVAVRLLQSFVLQVISL